MIGQREKELLHAFNRAESMIKRVKPGASAVLRISLQRVNGNVELKYFIGTPSYPDDSVMGVSFDDALTEWARRQGYEESQKQLLEPPAVASDDFTEI